MDLGHGTLPRASTIDDPKISLVVMFVLTAIVARPVETGHADADVGRR
jgi:hypothetical protein